MQTRKIDLVTLFVISYFILVSHPLFSSEVDQFTDREKYQDSALDFTPVLNEHTNELIQQGIQKYNEKYSHKNLTLEEIHQKTAFEIYMVTAGSPLDRIFLFIPDKVGLPYALVYKSGSGPTQKWIKRKENIRYWTFVSNNIYSDTYPDAFNKAVLIKVGGEFIGSDKVDHFFDQGYSYFVRSDFGRKDELARKYGRDSEYGYYGLKASGVFSFGDLRANWGGYQFYKNLFSGSNSLLVISEKAFVSMRHSFDWSEYIDWQFDELKNPSKYTPFLEKRIYKHIKKNIDSYRKTYKFLEAKDMFSQAEKRDSYYLTEDLQNTKSSISYFKDLFISEE